MDRRAFLAKSAFIGSLLYFNEISKTSGNGLAFEDHDEEMYAIFKDPSSLYRPFVRWWWNGNKVDSEEILRELRLMKSIGIGGVEINPIEFPPTADDMGIESVEWLSPKWVDLVKGACEDAHSLGMINDLIVGSGWPFGMETLKEEERAQVMIVYAKELEGPVKFTTSGFNIIEEVDPGVTVKNPSRRAEIMSLYLVRSPMDSLADAIDFSKQGNNEKISIDVPPGKHFFYALVKYTSFADVINGAPGASGPILDHMNKRAVERYLNRMSDGMQQQIGPLSNYLRALFHDSMELEGSNWTGDFAEEFKRRRGYDVLPYLPFIMFRVGRLGNVEDENYGAAKTERFRDILNRVRFDFEFVKASLLKERFTDTYLSWCKHLGIKSRGQSYGRGFFRLISSMGFDIPEGESWTTNYLRHKLGEEMGDDDYRRGRGYTMINKYVSSAAHLSGKRQISCEEMTNTYLVFNTTLELLKVGSDQSIISGITHSVLEGFNYSPKEASFPGWIRYGSYLNEKSNFWPYLRLFTDYKARLSSQLMNADQYADIAILPADFDLWTNHGVQTDPFPQVADPSYTSLLWEAISKTGGAADYISEFILKDAEIKNGKITYGKRSYSVLFLPEVSSMDVDSLEKILDFVKMGGRVYCIGHAPHKSLGLNDSTNRDLQVRKLVDEIQGLKKGFKILPKPVDNRILEWYDRLQHNENLPKYLSIHNPDRYFMQNRYLRDDGSEFYFFQNANRNESYAADLAFAPRIIDGRRTTVWDAANGDRFSLKLNSRGEWRHDFGPAESLMIILDKDDGSKLNPFLPIPAKGYGTKKVSTGWKVKLHHSVTDQITEMRLDSLIDMKDDPRMEAFTGTATYTTEIEIENLLLRTILILGRVYGISELRVNGQPAGVKWYGRRLHDITGLLIKGSNKIEVRVVTTMGNYLKTLKDNKVAQYWVNRPGKEQEIQSMGLVGPILLYHI